VIALLPGDGIGPEVVAAAVRVLEAVACRFGHELVFSEHPIGGGSLDLHGEALTAETLAACRSADAVLLGAVGGPRWDDPAVDRRPEDGLLALRRGLSVFANLRPVRAHPALAGSSPLKPERLAGVDLLVVRELTGGLYFARPKGRSHRGGVQSAVDTLRYSTEEIRRVVELAFRLAARRRRKVTSVDKANVLESSRLWREVAGRVAAEHAEVALNHLLVDTAAMRLITDAAGFDVLVTENMFGDILTDEAAVLAGSLGLLPSASLGAEGPGLYEPVHGSAPDIAGRGIANPVGAILSAALLLRYSLNLEAEALAIETTVDEALAAGCRTADLGGSLNTDGMTEAILGALTAAPRRTRQSRTTEVPAEP
jgi:3-isopropylmalate dehydrogenase